MGYDSLPDQDLGSRIGRMVDQSIVHASLEFLPHPSACHVRSLLPCLLLHLLPTALPPALLPTVAAILVTKAQSLSIKGMKHTQSYPPIHVATNAITSKSKTEYASYL